MEPKRHHYIPRATLGKFCFQGKTLYHYDKKTSEKGVESRNVKTVFKKYHLNSFKDSTGVTNANLEKWFGANFDNHIKDLTEKWEKMAAGISPFSISGEDRHFFVQFLYNLMKRTPDFHQSVIDKNMTEEALEDVLREAEENLGPISEQDKTQFIEDSKTENYRSKIRVKILADQSSKVLDLMKGKGIFLASPESARKQFIVASNPVTNFLNKRDTDMWDPSYEIWVTLSSRLAVCLTQSSKDSRTMAVSDTNVRKINLQLAKQSTSFAGANLRLIESLSKQS
ncbi:MAG: DUF4238 domain-containing protein [Rhodobacteraceae bacterium]|nr:DUF4238 domain-containing protein [Paracoccaceae bacterium]